MCFRFDHYLFYIGKDIVYVEANFSVLNYFDICIQPYFILLFLLQTYISLHVWCSIPISSKAEDSCAGKSKLREIHFSISFNLMIEIVQVISRIQRVVTIACTNQLCHRTFIWHFLCEFHVSPLFTWSSCQNFQANKFHNCHLHTRYLKLCTVLSIVSMVNLYQIKVLVF